MYLSSRSISYLITCEIRSWKAVFGYDGRYGTGHAQSGHLNVRLDNFWNKNVWNYVNEILASAGIKIFIQILSNFFNIQ